MAKYRGRRMIGVILALSALVGLVIANPDSYEQVFEPSSNDASAIESTDKASDVVKVVDVLARLEVKGRAPKTGYERTEFYNNWPKIEGCSLRQRILKREFGETAVLAEDDCTVLQGSFYEPYTGKQLFFGEKAEISKGLQIDHVVALSDAWQKGAQYKTAEERYALATDPLNLLAVDASANQQKSDGDAATWLPANKAFRCQYVARQVSVKFKYSLWVTQAEHDAIDRILTTCPNEPAVGVELD